MELTKPSVVSPPNKAFRDNLVLVARTGLFVHDTDVDDVREGLEFLVAVHMIGPAWERMDSAEAWDFLEAFTTEHRASIDSAISDVLGRAQTAGAL